jgi:hypothetical protein
MSNKRKKIIETSHLDATSGTISFPGEADGNVLAYNSGLRTWVGYPPSALSTGTNNNGSTITNADQANNANAIGDQWKVYQGLSNALAPINSIGTYQIGCKPGDSASIAPIQDVTSVNLNIRSSDAQSTNYTSLRGSAFATNLAYRLPPSQPAGNNVLRNDGSGNLFWSSANSLVDFPVVTSSASATVTSQVISNATTYSLAVVPNEVLKPWSVDNTTTPGSSFLKANDVTKSFELGVAPGSANTFAAGFINNCNAKSFTFLNSVSTAANLSTKIQSTNFAGAIVWTLPSAQGAANTVLTNDGSGALAWVDPQSIVRLPVVAGSASVNVSTSVSGQGQTTYTLSVISSGPTGVTQLSPGTGIVMTPSPITTTGVVSLDTTYTSPFVLSSGSLVAGISIHGTGRVTSISALPPGTTGQILTVTGTNIIGWANPVTPPSTIVAADVNAGLTSTLTGQTYSVVNTYQNGVSAGFLTNVTTSTVSKVVDGSLTAVGTTYDVGCSFRFETSDELPVVNPGPPVLGTFPTFEAYNHLSLLPAPVYTMYNIHGTATTFKDLPIVGVGRDRKGRLLTVDQRSPAVGLSQAQHDRLFLKFKDANTALVSGWTYSPYNVLDVISLADVDDVVLQPLTRKDVLTWDSVTSKWTNVAGSFPSYIQQSTTPANPGNALIFEYFIPPGPGQDPKFFRDADENYYFKAGINYRNISTNFCGAASFTAMPNYTDSSRIFAIYPTRKSLLDAGTNNCTGMLRMGQPIAINRFGAQSDLAWFDQSRIPPNPTWCTGGIRLSTTNGVWTMNANDPWNYMRVKGFAAFNAVGNFTAVYGRLLLTGWLNAPPNGEDWNPGNFDNYGGAGGYFGFTGIQRWHTDGISSTTVDLTSNPVFTRLGLWQKVIKNSNIWATADLDVIVRRADMIDTNLNFAVYVEMASNAKNPPTDSNNYDNASVPGFIDELGSSTTMIDQFRYTDSNYLYPGAGPLNPGNAFNATKVFPFMELSVEICS